MDTSSIASAAATPTTTNTNTTPSSMANASTTASSNSSNTSANGNLVSEDQFLKLFMAQLKNQDPMNPMDSAGFTSQLATFSSLEQLTTINTNLKNMSAYENSLNNISAVNMIGKSVTTTDNNTSQVTGITFKNGVTYLNLKDGESVVTSNIQQISQTA
ncbi:MAG: hypothetical protein HQK89_01995 [Nitrospirae bacterium]|nr:hypothetical protein [Nitrospirota bacterium]